MNANTHLLQVIILDPTQENTVELLSVAEMFYANNIPLRLVFLSSRCIHFWTFSWELIISFYEFEYTTYHFFIAVQ